MSSAKRKLKITIKYVCAIAIDDSDDDKRQPSPPPTDDDVQHQQRRLDLEITIPKSWRHGPIERLKMFFEKRVRSDIVDVFLIINISHLTQTHTHTHAGQQNVPQNVCIVEIAQYGEVRKIGLYTNMKLTRSTYDRKCANWDVPNIKCI